MEKISEKRNLNSLIIHPDIEPGVIDNDMITRCVIEYGPKEEAGRLFKEEGVHLDEATVVRLEFQNILRINHLWMLKSLTKLTLAHNLIEKIDHLEQLTKLTDLDLSFNKIEKIENLETLVNLEILTLFHNKITKLENMETLEKLLVFSIGDNLIEDFRQLAYLRQFRFLRSVSVKGNPCCEEDKAYHFFKAALVKVTYLDYKTITEDEREAGRVQFRSVIRQLDEEDEIKEKARLAKEDYDAKVKFYALSFVEYLSGPELLESMFTSDPDGMMLLTIGGELIQFYDQYKEQYVETMETLVEFAQTAYNDRQNEIKLFKDLVDNALAESVIKSREVLSRYHENKKIQVQGMLDLTNKFQSKQMTLEEVDPIASDLAESFNDLLYEVWKELMTIEMNLYEQCEESRVQFAVNMTEKITKLQEASRTGFGAWREHDGTWSMRQFETLSKLLGNKTLLGDISPDLMEIMMDRDQMMNLVAQSSDNHMRFIDAREDLLMTRATTWLDELVQSTNENEIKRNRDRILEINYFIDNQREEWVELQMNLTEPLDAEAAALLGEDF